MAQNFSACVSDILIVEWIYKDFWIEIKLLQGILELCLFCFTYFEYVDRDFTWNKLHRLHSIIIDLINILCNFDSMVFVVLLDANDRRAFLFRCYDRWRLQWYKVFLCKFFCCDVYDWQCILCFEHKKLKWIPLKFRSRCN